MRTTLELILVRYIVSLRIFQKIAIEKKDYINEVVQGGRN
jgi:hypothetical protein